jgi:transposase InsO family protein
MPIRRITRLSWKQVGVSDERMRFVIEASKPGSCMTVLCRQFGVSRQTGYTWLKRYQEGGAAAVLNERSRRPHSSPKQSPQAVVTALTEARQERPDWGARKLTHVMAAAHPDLPSVTASTLQRILEREGLIDRRDRQQIALKRFERKHPNELWQMDFKGPQGFNKASGPLSIQDDYSRYVLALRHMSKSNTGSVQAVLQATFQECGLPEYLLLDHGKPWYDGVNPWGWTQLTVWILRQGVRITFSGVRHPQTQGKVERMHGALQRAIRKRKPPAGQQSWLDAFRHEYNHLRPHEGIGMILPAQRWKPSSRTFNPNVGEWEYPAGWTTCRLGVQGQLSYKSKRWEVSRALRGQNVGLEPNGPRILIHYCNMAVREINVETGSNVMLPGNPFKLLQL